MKIKFIIPLLLSSYASIGLAESLQDKFQQALQVVSSATGALMDQQYSLADTKNVYAGQDVQQQIQALVKTEAQQLMLDVADVVRDMSEVLFEGTRNPGEGLRTQVCSISKKGRDLRRHAAFYEGYEDLHEDFKAYLDQFNSVDSILGCSL